MENIFLNYHFYFFLPFCIWILFFGILPRTVNSLYLLRILSLLFSCIFLLICLFFWLFLHNHFSTVFTYFSWGFFLQTNYIFGIDSLSLVFLILTFFLIPLSILISWYNIKYKYREFLLSLLLINFILIQIFCVYDLFFFYIFFESILIPMFFIIGIWGSRQRKIHAVYQFFFYTIAGSFLMLFSIFLIYSNIGSTDLRLLHLYGTNMTFCRQSVLWLFLFIAFAVKVPVFPFHIWLPEAHVEAPTVGSVILAGVLLKLGTYGLLRIVLCSFIDLNYYFTPLVYTLCILGIIYTSCSTVRQVDLKKVIAYASVGHMSYVILGLFSYNIQGLLGSIFLMISHGIVSGGLFFLIGTVYDRYKTRLIKYYSGLVQVMPLFSVSFFFLTLANISFPGTSNFVGEFLILVGLFENNILAALIATSCIILTAVYSIWLYNRVIFGSLKADILYKFSDLNRRELVIVSLFLLLCLVWGIKPTLLLTTLEPYLIKLLIYKI